ncbi:hypothetical protein EG329_004266 [Mollisiaceae sp. DMI_Dod_QoI]|nr:hypothetical protein EG329_004266 [Helotiales sp. DMI_Dod_QoI]
MDRVGFKLPGQKEKEVKKESPPKTKASITHAKDQNLNVQRQLRLHSPEKVRHEARRSQQEQFWRSQEQSARQAAEKGCHVEEQLEKLQKELDSYKTSIKRARKLEQQLEESRQQTTIKDKDIQKLRDILDIAENEQLKAQLEDKVCENNKLKEENAHMKRKWKCMAKLMTDEASIWESTEEEDIDMAGAVGGRNFMPINVNMPPSTPNRTVGSFTTPSTPVRHPSRATSYGSPLPRHIRRPNFLAPRPQPKSDNEVQGGIVRVREVR